MESKASDYQAAKAYSGLTVAFQKYKEHAKSMYLEFAW